MKYLTMLIPVILIAACAGTGSSGYSVPKGEGMAGGDVYNLDVRDAVMRGTTHGVNPL